MTKAKPIREPMARLVPTLFVIPTQGPAPPPSCPPLRRAGEPTCRRASEDG